MSPRAGLLAGVTLVVLLCGARVSASCRPGEGVESAAADRWGLEAPDASTVIWSGESGFTLTEASPPPSQPMVRTPSGGYTGAGGAGPRLHRYCPIDWSPDSRYLLAREVALVVRADQYDRTAYRILERGGLPGRPVNLLRLWGAVEDHWSRKGRDVSLGGGYSLEAVGWESAPTRRIVYAAWRRLTREIPRGGPRAGAFVEPAVPGRRSTRPQAGPAPPVPPVDPERSERFLGYWSIDTTGLDPRLLAETIDGFRVSRFGRILAPPGDAPPGSPSPAVPTGR